VPSQICGKNHEGVQLLDNDYESDTDWHCEAVIVTDVVQLHVLLVKREYQSLFV
jgi:hypothetical protein